VSDKTSSNSPGQFLWNFFASVKLSFALLLLLALFSMAGTLIPQNEHPSTYLQHFGEIRGRLILSLGLEDLYHSPLFLLIMFALAANLVICSAKRLPTALKIMGKDLEQDAGRTVRPEQSFSLNQPYRQAAERAKEILQARVGRVLQAGEGDNLVVLAQNGSWSRMGVFVVHASVLVILAGAVVGNIWGFSGSVNLDQGQTVRTFTLENGKTRAMGFCLRLDEFTVSFYRDGTPSEYRSDVTFWKKGGHGKKAVIKVNQPASFGGIDFYQSTWGRAYPFRLLGQDLNLSLKLRQWTDLPGGGRVILLDFQDNVQMGGRYQGPAARLAYSEKGGGEPMVLFAFKAGSKMPGQGPVKFEITEGPTVNYSGLQVKYDPGVWLVFLGCGLMVMGFFIAFYLSHKKVWIRLSPAGGGGTLVQVAGTANKNRPALKRLLLKLAEEMQKAA